MTDFLTGNHAEINAITRAKSEERQKIFSNLPQKTQEMLITKPTFFEGSSHDAWTGIKFQFDYEYKNFYYYKIITGRSLYCKYYSYSDLCDHTEKYGFSPFSIE